MAACQLLLLGGFELRNAADSPIEISARKARAFLAYLALQPDRTATRERLSFLLWGGRDEALAAGNLRQTLTLLRKDLGALDPPPLRIDRDTIALDPSIEVDAVTFACLAASGALADLEAAARLYRGDLLDGLTVREAAFEAWLEGARRDLRDKHFHVLLDALDDKQARGDLEAARELGARCLSLDPLQERAHRALMRVYAATGERASALQQYQICRDTLEAELRVEPEPETVALYDALRENGSDHREPAATSHDPPSIEKDAESAGNAPARTEAPARRLASRDWRAFAGFGVAAVIALSLATDRVWLSTGARTPPGHGVAENPARPSIAVLPFDNLSGDPDQTYLADGITSDIITNLAKNTGLLVISRNSSFSYGREPVSVQRISQELGVSHILEGALLRSGDGIRIKVQLVDAATDRHVWAERYDRSLAGIFEVQDQISAEVLRALQVRPARGRSAEAQRAETQNVEAYVLFLRAMHQRYSEYSKESWAAAINLLEQAVALDPGYARAHAWLALFYWSIRNEQWTVPLGIPEERATEKLEYHLAEAEKAPTGMFHYVRAKIFINEGKHDEAIREAKKHVELEPNDPYGLSNLARTYNKAGEFEKGLEISLRVEQIDPLESQPGWLWRQAESYFHTDRYDKAVEEYEAYAASEPDYEWTYARLASAYALAGRMEDAKRALARFEELRSAMGHEPTTVSQNGNNLRYERDRERYKRGLRLAGMAE